MKSPLHQRPGAATGARLAVTIGLALLASALVLAPRQASAQADIPFYADTEVEPNILFVVDISGSMGWDFQVMEGAMRSRLDAIKRVFTGQYANGSGPDATDRGDGVLDVFGSLVNFALGSYGGSPQPSNSSISFPNGGNPKTFINADNNGLQSTILALSAGGATPTTQAMRDAGCWLVGPTAMDEAFRLVATSTDPLLPLPNGGEVITTTDQSGACPNSFGDNSIPLSPTIDPSFECRRTFIILATDGQETTGWGYTPPNQRPPDTQPERRKTVASALRRMPYLPAGDKDTPKIPTFVVLVAPCSNDPVEQVDDVYVSSGAVGVIYAITIDGTSCSYLSTTNNRRSIRDALINTVNNCGLAVSAAPSNNSRYGLEITHQTGGVPVNVSVSPMNRLNYSLSQAASDGKSGPNSCTDENPLIQEGNTWAKYGGTDATPGPKGCSEMVEGNGNFAYLGTDVDSLNLGLRQAIGCAIEGTHTRAEPTFVATSTNFAKNLEIDAYFDIVVGEPWWRGQLQAFTFEQINAEPPDFTNPAIDAGPLLNDRNGGNPRKLTVALKRPYSPPKVDVVDPSAGAVPNSGPPPPLPADTVPFTTVAASIPLATILGTTTDQTDYLITLLRDEDGAANTIKFPSGQVKPWSLGPIVNSSPVIVSAPHFDFRVGNGEEYATFIRAHAKDPDMIIAGAQDGFLHSFLMKDEGKVTNAALGEELWGFMPYEAILRMPTMTAGTVFTVDGSPSVSTVRFFGPDPVNPKVEFKTVLVVGLRGGGFSYMALDITDPLTPKLLWQVTHPSMGRTFSKPNIGEYQIEWDSNTVVRRWLVAMGAGFNGTRPDGDPVPVNPDECFTFVAGKCFDEDGKEITPPSGTISGADLGLPDVGNWVLFYDVETGRFVQNVRIGDLVDEPRYNAIPGNLLALDRDLNGTIDNVIAGDTEGRLWKVITWKQNPAEWWTDKRPSDDPAYGTDKGLSPCVMFDQTSVAAKLGLTDADKPKLRRPIFYAPAATFDCNGFVNLIWGTGDLTDPNAVTAQDYLFAINDPDASSCGQGHPDDEARSFRCDNITDTALNKAIEDAFPVPLPEPGEKILSTPLIVDGAFHVNTFIPGESGCGKGGSRNIWGPAICCRLKVADGKSALQISVVTVEPSTSGASPPLILGPDGQIMTVRKVADAKGDKTTRIGELTHSRRLLHWVQMFGVGCIDPQTSQPGTPPTPLEQCQL